jgi:hypothetical protein
VLAGEDGEHLALDQGAVVDTNVRLARLACRAGLQVELVERYGEGSNLCVENKCALEGIAVPRGKDDGV